MCLIKTSKDIKCAQEKQFHQLVFYKSSWWLGGTGRMKSKEDVLDCKFKTNSRIGHYRGTNLTEKDSQSPRIKVETALLIDVWIRHK